MLPFPMSTAVFSGSTDGWLGQLVNTSVVNQTFARYRFAFYDKDVATKTNPYVLSLANSVTITGQRAVPPDAPTVASKSKRSQAIEVAESYYRKRANNSRSFGYGGNFITYANSNVVNDPYGNAMMECDTFVCLVLMGIKYEDSPYTDTSPSATYNFADLRYNPHGYTWTIPLKNDDPNYILTDDVKMWDLSTRKITYTGLMNFLFWTKRMVFKNQAQAEAGDVVIFTEPDGKYFDGITHIGIVDKVDGE